MGCGPCAARNTAAAPPAPAQQTTQAAAVTPMAKLEEEVSEAAVEEGIKTVGEQRAQLQRIFTKMVPEVLAACLSGSSLENGLNDFIRTNSPRFKNFTEKGDGDLMMSDVHRQYVAMVEELLEAKTKDWPTDLNADFFAEVSGEGMKAVLDETGNVLDFVSFGRMMRKKYEEQFATDAIRPGGRTHVRVLWDFENINPLRSSKPVQDAAERLENFLRERLCKGANVDYVTTAFMPPSAVNQVVLKGLDRATVVIILCTAKREDADRKLVDAIDRDCRVLDPTRTTFVLVSSDTDFKSKLQNLRAQGYRTVTVHEYDTKCSARQALEQHADHAYVWGEIIGSKGKAPDPQPVKPASPIETKSNGLPVYPNLAFEEELVGMVVSWIEHRGFGFIRVLTKSSPGYIDFFCHARDLSIAKVGPKYLVPGELVKFTSKRARHGTNNTAASNVRAAAGRLTCES